jgi:hypothetical protein
MNSPCRKYGKVKTMMSFGRSCLRAEKILIFAPTAVKVSRYGNEKQNT